MITTTAEKRAPLTRTNTTRLVAPTVTRSRTRRDDETDRVVPDTVTLTADARRDALRRNDVTRAVAAPGPVSPVGPVWPAPGSPPDDEVTVTTLEGIETFTLPAWSSTRARKR